MYIEIGGRENVTFSCRVRVDNGDFHTRCGIVAVFIETSEEHVISVQRIERVQISSSVDMGTLTVEEDASQDFTVVFIISD